MFAWLDISFGIDIRLKIPWDYNTMNIYYYSACFLAGVFAFKNPLTAALFGLLESSFNILLLLVSVMWPVISLGNQVDNTSAPVFQFGLLELFQFIMVGCVLLASYHMNPLINRKQKLF